MSITLDGSLLVDSLGHSAIRGVDVAGWQKWLRTQLDRPKGNYIVVSASNAQLLSGELASALTGRHLSLELFPFDLVEFRQVRPKGTLEEYIESGGFPEASGFIDAGELAVVATTLGIAPEPGPYGTSRFDGLDWVS